MNYRNALPEDLPQVLALQQLYHVSTIDPDLKKDGFVTTLFTEEQLTDLIKQENGLAVACDGDRIVAYVMAASWHFWQAWPFFRHMTGLLPEDMYLGQTLSMENSYQYGPVCIHKEYRGKGVLAGIFEFSRQQMTPRFPILITFINHVNPRSYHAHVQKLGLEVVRNFEFNNNQYYELGYDTSKPLADL